MCSSDLYQNGQADRSMACSCGAGGCGSSFLRILVHGAQYRHKPERRGIIFACAVSSCGGGTMLSAGPCEAGTVLCGLCGNVRCASSSFSGCRRVLPGGVPAELQPWLGRYLSLPAGLWGTAMPLYPKKVCAVTVQAGLCIHCTDREKTWRHQASAPRRRRL